MSPKLYCAIPNSYVVNGATELKGKYVKIISVNDWSGSIINVKVSNYGNGSYFYIILCLATNNIGRWASGKLIAGNISGFSFYRVDKSIYMFIPDSIQDLYVTLDASMGNVSYGEEYENTIDLSNPITISWHNSLSTLDLGGLIGTATASKNGLVPYYAGGVLSFQYGVKVSLGSIYRPFTCTISTYENAANTFIIAHINITGGSCAKALSRVGTVKIKYSASTKNIYIYNTTGDPIALQRLLNSVGREVTGFSQISSEPTESDLVDIPINALWFTDWFKWRKFNGTEL